MNTIIFVGFMGAGKTSIGKRFSEKNKMEFIDTDKKIEEKASMKISDIFATHGEEYFRKLETNILSELLNMEEKKVISVGGGLPMREENRKLLKQLGFVVFLEATKETILERIGYDMSRPLLAGEDREEKIDKLLEERSPIYRELSDLIIKTDQKSFFEIIEEIEVKVNENTCH